MFWARGCMLGVSGFPPPPLASGLLADPQTENCHLADRDPAGRVVLYCLMCRVPFMYIPTMG